MDPILYSSQYHIKIFEYPLWNKTGNAVPTS